MFKRAKPEFTTSDLKKANNELYDLYKELKKEVKQKKDKIISEEFFKIDLDLDYKSVRISQMDTEDLKMELLLTSLIKSTLMDAQEMLKKGTNYGLQLALHRVQSLVADRQVGKSPYAIEDYRKFDEELWNITRLREFAYGQIERLKRKQDQITRSALQEVDSMMRVRYFDDIRVLEKDILRLENEAHQYDTLTTALHSDAVLKNIVKRYSLKKDELPDMQKFENLVLQYDKKNN